MLSSDCQNRLQYRGPGHAWARLCALLKEGMTLDILKSCLLRCQVGVGLHVDEYQDPLMRGEGSGVVFVSQSRAC